MKHKNYLRSIASVTIPFFLFLILASSMAFEVTAFNVSPAITVTQISTGELGNLPDIYDNNIVWQNGDGSDFTNLTVYNISTQKETQIPTNRLTVPQEPKIYGDRIVYIDSSNESYDIYMYNLSTSEREKISANGSVHWPTTPDIYGDIIVWGDYWGYDNNIYMYDLSTGKETQISNNVYLGNSPSIYEDKVVWEESNSSFNHDVSWHMNDVYVYNISTNKTSKIINGEANFCRFLPIYGDNIVWQNWISDNIYVYNLTTNTNTLVSYKGETYYSIFGDRVMWTDLTSSGNTNIYLYNLTTSKEIQITTDKSKKLYPAIFGDKIVWEEYSNSNVPKICLCNIFDTQIVNFSSDVTKGYSPLEVHFTDLSQNATGWNWDFGDRNASTEQNPVHTYSGAGTYNVKLNITSGDSTYSTFAAINVLPTGPCAYIANSGSSNLSVIDTTTNNVISTIDANIIPWGVAVNPVKSEAYVSNIAGNNVVVIDTVTNKVIDKVCVGSNPAGVAVSPDGTKVYVANTNSNNISIINSETKNVTATVELKDSPYTVAVNPAGKELFITNYNSSGTVSIVDTATNNVLATVSVGSFPEGLAVTPDGKKLYVANLGGNVSVIDTENNIVTTSIKVGNNPVRVAVTPDGKKLYVTNTGSDNVSVIDTENNSVTTSVQVGSSPRGVAVTPDGKMAYVTNSGSDNVSIIDTATDNVISTVKVGSYPVALGQFIGGKILLPVNPAIDVVSLPVISDNSEDNGGTSSGGGGSGGSGGSISPELQSNVEAKEASQTFIVNGNYINFGFPQNTTPIINLSFDSKKTAGKTTAIVEMLINRSTLVSETPSNEVYKYVNIWVGNSGFATPENIENAVIFFKVEKSWIRDNKIDKSSITLNRFTDKEWNQLSTHLSGENENYLYFTTQTPGFSPFAITGKTTATGTTIQPADGTKTKTQLPLENNTLTNPRGNSTASFEPKNKQNYSSNFSGKESTKIPDFEIISSIVCLLSVFLYKRR